MNTMRCAAPLLVLLALLGHCQPAAGPLRQAAVAVVPDPTAAIKPLAAIIDSLRIDPKAIGFKVRKAQRRFEVIAQGRVLKDYPCMLGEVPVSDKLHQGDRRIPEGSFTFRSKRVHAEWHTFIWIDYPNAESRRSYRARMAEGLIPRGKGIGGEIGIHGVPDGMDHWIDAGVDWTWGCIALRSADADEAYPYIVPGLTLMEVVPLGSRPDRFREQLIVAGALIGPADEAHAADLLDNDLERGAHQGAGKQMPAGHAAIGIGHRHVQMEPMAR